MNRRVLFVDDEPAVVAGIERNLRKHFEVHTETDPRKALELLDPARPFAVIVADMRMSGMDGVEFLYEARRRSPTSVRVMLTGDATRQTPIGAVNRADVFKFVTKPCETDVLKKVVELAVRQHDIDTAQKAVLEDTVRGCVTALAEVLALAQPAAFGRVHRLRALANAIAAHIEDCDAWELDAAALLSQLGCVCLPLPLLEKVAAGAELAEAERAEYFRHPTLGAELVRNVPRLENVAEAIRHQLRDYDGGGPPHEGPAGDAIPLAARILRVALEHDALRSSGKSNEEALAVLMARRNKFDQRVLAALAHHLATHVTDAEPVSPAQLECGMIVEQDVVADQGVLLLCRGQEVTPAVRAHLRRFHLAGELPGPILVSRRAAAGTPPGEAAATLAGVT
jgi:response regulator RpfG family c-di-GMP phosphodiesterase